MISLDDAPRGYQEFDKGAAKKYVIDPNGIMVEFCCLTRTLDENDAAEAEAILANPAPSLEEPPRPEIFRPIDATVSA